MKNIKKLVLCLCILLTLTACGGGSSSVSFNDTVIDKDYAKITLKKYEYEILSDAKKDDGVNSSAEEKYGLVDKKDIYNLWGYFTFDIENKTDEDIEFIVWPFSYFYNSDAKNSSNLLSGSESSLRRGKLYSNHSLDDYSKYVVLVPAKSTKSFTVEKVESGISKEKKNMKIKDFLWVGVQIGLNGTIIGDVVLDYENDEVNEDLLDIVVESNTTPQQEVIEETPQQIEEVPQQEVSTVDVPSDDYIGIGQLCTSSYMNVDWCDDGACYPAIEQNTPDEVYLVLRAGGGEFEFMIKKDSPYDVYYYPINTGEWILVWSNGNKLFNELPQ